MTKLLSTNTETSVNSKLIDFFEAYLTTEKAEYKTELDLDKQILSGAITPKAVFEKMLSSISAYRSEIEFFQTYWNRVVSIPPTKTLCHYL